jgi:tRNA-dihydrouridine synthase B
VRAVVNATPLPVTAKIRAGWDHKTINVEEVGAAVQEAGAAGMMIHARTRAQGFTGNADWSFVARLRAAVTLPVMGNGDVVDVAGVRRMLAETECDGVYIGRGAVGNPWIFADVNAAFAGGEPVTPEWTERRAVLLDHLEMLEWEKGTRVALNEIRTPLSGYLKGFRGASTLRKLLFETRTLADFRQILLEFEVPLDIEGLAYDAVRAASDSAITFDETCPSEAALAD